LRVCRSSLCGLELTSAVRDSEMSEASVMECFIHNMPANEMTLIMEQEE